MNVRSIADILEIDDYKVYLSAVDNRMIDALDSRNKILNDPIIKVIKAGGKRLRPLLLYACAQQKSSKNNIALINAGAAIELLHVSSLIHDDIIDNSDQRHGIASVNKQVGLNNALLSGDYAFAASFQLANKSSPLVTGYISDAFKAMCEGQSEELNSKFDLNRTMASYIRVIHDKTATLLGTSCAIGGSFGHHMQDIDLLYSFGEAYGMAFQLLDDLSDLTLKSSKDGKPIQHDIDEGVYTYPVILSLKSIKNKSKFVNTKMPSAAAIRKDVTRKQINLTVKEINKYQEVAHKKASLLQSSNLTTKLISFADWYIEVSLKTLLEA